MYINLNLFEITATLLRTNWAELQHTSLLNNILSKIYTLMPKRHNRLLLPTVKPLDIVRISKNYCFPSRYWLSIFDIAISKTHGAYSKSKQDSFSMKLFMFILDSANFYNLRLICWSSFNKRRINIELKTTKVLTSSHFDLALTIATFLLNAQRNGISPKTTYLKNYNNKI